MQAGDNKDNRFIEKCGNEAAVMEEKLLVRNNSLQMDSEGIGSDTGQVENDSLTIHSVRVRSDSTDSDLVGAELGLLATLADPETRRRMLAEDCDLSNIELPTVGDTTDEEYDDMSSCSESGDSKEWITLRPDDENLDPSKIAALSSAFSSYISSPKRSKGKHQQQQSSQDDAAPNMGQFLLPLVTQQLPREDLPPNVETDHSVIEVLAAEAKRFKKAGDEMSALAWRILGEYHALENNTKTDDVEGIEVSSEQDVEQKEQVMHLISKCMNEDDALLIFQQLNKELEERDQIPGVFCKLVQNDASARCVDDLESNTIDTLKKFSETSLVKSVLRYINGDKSDTYISADTQEVETAVEEEVGQDEGMDQSDVGRRFKFLENSSLRSTLEQYMMMQIASREAEAEQNQQLLRELGGITDTSGRGACLLSSIHGSNTTSGDGCCQEPAQRIFECDSVNTSSRFIPLEESALCPGGCGNLRHCTRYRNNGANLSPSGSMPSLTECRGPDGDGEQGGVQEGDGKEKQTLLEDEAVGRVVDAQAGWWELRALLCALWRAADVGGLACKNVAVATVPPCHCCRCSHPALRQTSEDPGDSCFCNHQDSQHPNQPRERCRKCLTSEVGGLPKHVWGAKVDFQVPAECCCRDRRSKRNYHSCVVRLFFKDPSSSPIDFDLSKTEFEQHNLEVEDRDSEFLNECHRRYINGEEDIQQRFQDIRPVCARCRCKCGYAKFYCPKLRDKTIKENIDNFTRLAPQLLILRLDALCSALCAWHGAHLSGTLAGGAVMTFLKELWRRAAAMRNGGIALSGILGPTRRRLATVCGRLLAPHQYLSVIYRAWADRVAATRVVHLSMLQLLGRAPPQTVEALHSFSSLLSMMNEAETLRGDVTTFLGNYRQCERDEYLIWLRSQMIAIQRNHLQDAKYLGLLGDDPCELTQHLDCECSVVARELSECLPTDPAELDEFKQIVQAMLLYHSSGGGVSQLTARANCILSGNGGAKREQYRRQQSEATAVAEVIKHNISDNVINEPRERESESDFSSLPDTDLGADEGSALDNDGSSLNKCNHSAAVIRRRQQLEKEFVEREKCRIVNSIYAAINSGHGSEDSKLSSDLFQDSKIAIEATKRSRPVKRKFKTNDNCAEDLSGEHTTTTVTLRMKQGCLKAGVKPNRIIESAKGRHLKGIRRASVGHMAEGVRQKETRALWTNVNCAKTAGAQTKRGRSVSLFSESRQYLESAIYESICPLNKLQLPGNDNVLRWYSMPDVATSRDSDSEAALDTTPNSINSFIITDKESFKRELIKLRDYKLRKAMELKANLKGLTAKLIPELFSPPSSVDPSIDIELKSESETVNSGKAVRVIDDDDEDNILEKLRKPVFENETPEQKYLRMQMCECLEKMELLGLEDQELSNKNGFATNIEYDDDNVPSPPLELSPTMADSGIMTNDILNSNHKRRILTLNRPLIGRRKTAECNSMFSAAQRDSLNESDGVVQKESSDSNKAEDCDIDMKSNSYGCVEAGGTGNQSDKPNENISNGTSLSPEEVQANRILDKYMEEIKNTPNIHNLKLFKEHDTEADTLKGMLDPLSLMKTFVSRNILNLSDDLSLLTPETIKQLKEVRHLKVKKQTCGKRKNVRKNSECSKGGKEEKTHTLEDPILMEDPTKEEIMIEMLAHRHKKKGFRSAKEFHGKLLTASLQVVMRKVLQVMMPCEDDIELDHLKQSGMLESPYDVKVGSQIDGFTIDDYWDTIESQFSSYRAFTLDQYWNLPEHYRKPIFIESKTGQNAGSESRSDCNQCKENTSDAELEEQRKQAAKKSFTSKIISLDPNKAKSYLTPVEHALFVERLQAVNKDYVDKLLKQNLTGEDWIFAMNELQHLERKLKTAVKGKSSTNNSSNSWTGSRITEETREAELLAGRGLSKLINQFSKKDVKQDPNSKSTKWSTGSTDSNKTETKCSKPSLAVTSGHNTNQSSKTDSLSSSDTRHKDTDKELMQMAKTDVGVKVKDNKSLVGVFNSNADKSKPILVSGKARPVVLSQTDSVIPNTKSINAASSVKNKQDCPTCIKHIRDVHDGDTSSTTTNSNHACEGCHRTRGNVLGFEVKCCDRLKDTAVVGANKHNDSTPEAHTVPGGNRSGGRSEASPCAKVAAADTPALAETPESHSKTTQSGHSKADQHHHSHQHTCTNAHQEGCVNSSHPAEGHTNRCVQHGSVSSRSNSATSGHSSSSSSGSSSNGEQPCNCCYCTVFGHAPPVTTPVSKNFNETRERLRSILNRKKQRSRPGFSTQGGGDVETKECTKRDDVPSLIPLGPIAKPDPLPVSSAHKPKALTPAAIPASQTSQKDVKPGSVQPKQQLTAKTVQGSVNNSKPLEAVTKKLSTPSLQLLQNAKANSDSPNLPLKLKIKQSDGQMAMQNEMKKDGADTIKNKCKESAKAVAGKDPWIPQSGSVVKKGREMSKALSEPLKSIKDSVNESIKQESPNSSNSKVPDKRQATACPEKVESVARQPEQSVVSRQDQEKQVEEQNLKNAKRQKMITNVEEPKVTPNQTDKPRNVQPRALNIHKTGPQPLQTPQQARRATEQQNKGRGSVPGRPQEAHNSASNATSRDCSVFSTSTVCSGCSVDPRDLDMLMEFIEGPGSVMDKIKKKTKKSRQKAKKMIEKLKMKLSLIEPKAAQLRAESNKLDKLLDATVGKKKKPSKKGKKKGENEVEDERIIALRKTAREYREIAALAEKELDDGKKMLNRVVKALLLIGSTEDISQLPEVIAVQQQVSQMSLLDEKEDLKPTLLPHQIQELERRLANKTQKPQQQPTQSTESSPSACLDQILAGSLQKQGDLPGKPPSQCMVTIKRVMMPETGEPSVTITPKGSDKPIYTFQNHSGSISHQVQHYQHIQENDDGNGSQEGSGPSNKKKTQGPSWEATLAQINSLSQSKKKTKQSKSDVEKSNSKPCEPRQQQNANVTNKEQKNKTNKKTGLSSVNSSLYPSRSMSTVSESSHVETNEPTSKKQRKRLAKKLKEEEEERERIRLEEAKVAAQKGGNIKKNSKGSRQEAVAGSVHEVDGDPDKIVLSMKQLKTAVERALEAMDSDVGGKKLQGKGKLKDTAKEFIEKVVSKVEETKMATATQTSLSGRRPDKVVDISEVVLGSFSSKMASVANKQPQKNNNQQTNKKQPGANSQQQKNQLHQHNLSKQKQKDEPSKGTSNKAVNSKKNAAVSGRKAQAPSQTTTSVHQRTGPQTSSTNSRAHPPNQLQLNDNYMDKFKLNSDITIQLADKGEANPCGASINDVKPGGPVSCSIMEQLRNGVQVPNLKLPPGITLTWVDPNKKQPEPAPKTAIPVVKLSSVAPEYRPTPPVVNPPPLIMVDTKNIPHNKDPKTQVTQSAETANLQQDSNKSVKSKKSKKKNKKNNIKLPQQTETSIHSHQRAEEQPKMVTLRNPMFHPSLPSVSLSSVQSGKRVSENIRIPDPIPMPPNACQATITPTSNGMFTIRNPLMSMVHQQNMMSMKDAPPNPPVVLMSSSGSVVTTDVCQMKDKNINVDLAGRMADMGINQNAPAHETKEDGCKMSNPNSDFLAQNITFTPNKDNGGYSLFKSEHVSVSSPMNVVVLGQQVQEGSGNICPSPIGSKTNRTPPTQMGAARQLDFNPAKQLPQHQIPVSGWQEGPMPVGVQSREEVSSDSGIDSGPPGFYTPFGQADSDKFFGSLLFGNNPRDDHEYVPNQPDNPSLVANMDGKQPTVGGNRGEFRPQPTPVGYNAKSSTSIWNGPGAYNYQQEYSAQPYQQGGTYGASFPTSVGQSYPQIRSSHSSSSSGLMTGSVISSGTNSVYDSVSNSSSNSPADATSQEVSATLETANMINMQQSSPESRTYNDFTPYMAMLQQQPNGGFGAFNRVTDSPGSAERMAELLASNQDRLSELGWYTLGNTPRAMADTFNQLRLTEEQNFMNQPQTRLNSDFNSELGYYNMAHVPNAAPANNFSPNSANSIGSADVLRQVNAKLNVDALQINEETNVSHKYGAIGQGKQQSMLAEEGLAKNLGAIGSHRSAAPANGVRQEEYYPGWGF